MATVPQRPKFTEPAAPPLGLHRRLDLDAVLAALKHDGLISEDDRLRARADGRSAHGKLELHPLVLIANQKLTNPQDGKPLSLEVLTHWLADKAGLPYLKIDPMKIDAAAVTQVISHAYAQRYRILPVAVSPLQVVIATCEPFDTRWLADLGHILRRDIQRVVINPLDLNRYLAEFYGVQRSIQKAQDAKLDGGTDGRAILNFEQLLELGKAGDLGADDRHVVQSSTGCCNTLSISAHPTSISSHAATSGPIRFRIDGVLHKVFSCRHR